MTAHPEGMLDRALRPYEPPRTPALFGRVAEAGLDPVDPDEELLTPDAAETTLEVVAEALAAAYAGTTFATAGALIAELEKRGLHLARVRTTGSTHFVKPNEEIRTR